MRALKNILLTAFIILVLGAASLGIYRYIRQNGVMELVKDSIATREDSGITGEGYEFDPEYYPYYSFLSDDARKLYCQVYANAEQLKTTFIPVVMITAPEADNVIRAVYHDHPGLFWLNSGYSYKYREDNICVQLTLEFNETIDYIDEARRKFDEKADGIISGASALSDDYEKEKYVFDAIMKAADYDMSAALNQSPYSALVLGRSVCAGYARAFQYIMTKLQIPTYYCAGMSQEHAWNIVKLENSYYNVDVTWADKNERKNEFFNQTDDALGYTHRRSGYSVLLPRCRGTKYQGMY